MQNCWGSQNAPRLFFFDLGIWETALKLKAQLQNSCRSQKAYVEALGIALAHELTRMNEDTPLLASDARGGLPHCEARRSSTGLPGGCAPCQLLLLAGPEHGRTIPLADINQLEIPQRNIDARARCESRRHHSHIRDGETFRRP
jgi:hypothetical protein